MQLKTIERESPAALRHRLMSPPNAVPDLGIDLKRKRDAPRAFAPSAPAPAIVIAPPARPPRWLAGLIEFNEALRKLNRIESVAPRISIHTVRMVVAEHYGVSITEMDGPSCRRLSARPRFIAMFLCARLLPITVIEIGQIFGGRHHNTVYIALQRVQERVEGSVKFKQELDALTDRIKRLHSSNS